MAGKKSKFQFVSKNHFSIYSVQHRTLDLHEKVTPVGITFDPYATHCKLEFEHRS